MKAAIRRLLLALCVISVAATQARAEPQSDAHFTGELWKQARPIYAKTLEHPFLTGLRDGSLPRKRFTYYLIQDAHYLRAFGQALNVLAARAPREDWSLTLSQHAIDALKAEREFHNSVLESYGVSQVEVQNSQISPTNLAYTNHLLVTAEQKPFAQGLAAMLPCYWIYWEVGKALQKDGSKNSDYQRWIDQYSGEDYGQTVRQILDMMNAAAALETPDARREMKLLFERSARYEWMFWDMAWREEAWPPG